MNSERNHSEENIPEREPQHRKISRRGFLAALGAAAIGLSSEVLAKEPLPEKKEVPEDKQLEVFVLPILTYKFDFTTYDLPAPENVSDAE